MSYFKMISLALGKMLISPEKNKSLKQGKLETSIADKNEDLNTKKGDCKTNELM